MALFTIVNQQEIDNLLLQYSIGNIISFNGIKEGIQNTNYMIKTQKGNFILTIYEKFYNSPQDLPFFTELLRHLEKKNIPCPKPIPTKNDTFFVSFKKKPAAIYSFIEGLQADKLSLDTDICYQAGKKLAQIHLATQDFNIKRKNQIGIEKIYQKFIEWENQFPEIQKPVIAKEIKQKLEYIIKNYPQDETQIPKSIIHADFFTDNVFFEGKQISGVIDFNFSCNDFMIYDLAIAINAWCFKNNGEIFDQELAEAMKKGYNSIRKILDREMEFFKIVSQAAAMRYLVSRLYDEKNTPKNAIIQKKDPKEYLNILRFHSENSNHTKNSIIVAKHEKKQTIEIYIDGSCLGNPGPGAWAVLIISEKDKKTFTGTEAKTTNNRMELLAAINALEKINSENNSFQKFTIYTDSKYVFEGVNKWLEGWKKNKWRKSNNKIISNLELWQQMDMLVQKNKQKNKNIHWNWVKAHAGNKMNELADQIAREAAQNQKDKIEKETVVNQ